MAVGEPDEDIAQVGIGFDATRLAGADQAGKAHLVTATFAVTSEESVATNHCRAADGVLDEVGVDVDAAILEEQSEALLAA